MKTVHGEHLLKIDYQNSDPIWNRVKIPKFNKILFTQVLIGTLTHWLQRLSIKGKILKKRVDKEGGPRGDEIFANIFDWLLILTQFMKSTWTHSMDFRDFEQLLLFNK